MEWQRDNVPSDLLLPVGAAAAFRVQHSVQRVCMYAPGLLLLDGDSKLNFSLPSLLPSLPSLWHLQLWSDLHL